MNASRLLALGIIPLLASCTSPVTVSDSIGPNPFRAPVAGSEEGYLRVFSEEEPVTEGFDEGASPTVYQHSDYRVYDTRGKLVKYVGNTVGEYDSSPKLVSLPPGKYTVSARAKDYLSMHLPVVIQAGRTTNVHLDDEWAPPAGATSQLVMEPSGYAMGWRAK